MSEVLVRKKLKSSSFPAMGSSYFNSIQLTVFITRIVEFFMLQLLTAKKRFNSFFPMTFQPSIRSHSIDNHDSKEHESVSKAVDSIKINPRDAGIVLTSLGMVCSSEEISFPAKMDEDNILNLFNENEPGLDEVKEAFDVFDENRDGFIDAKELHKVLCALGLREGSEMENCRKMIGVYDEDGDGRIDFDEFVKFMEAILC